MRLLYDDVAGVREYAIVTILIIELKNGIIESSLIEAYLVPRDRVMLLGKYIALSLAPILVCETAPTCSEVCCS